MKTVTVISYTNHEGRACSTATADRGEVVENLINAGCRIDSIASHEMPSSPKELADLLNVWFLKS